MSTPKFIAAESFCLGCGIDISFVLSLHQNGLIDITYFSGKAYIDVNQLRQLEKLIRLYFELDINLEGLETIVHLLQQISSMHDEITALRNELLIFEPTGT